MRAVILCLLLSSLAACAAEIPNRLIDYPAFERNVGKVGSSAHSSVSAKKSSFAWRRIRRR